MIQEGLVGPNLHPTGMIMLLALHNKVLPGSKQHLEGEQGDLSSPFSGSAIRYWRTICPWSSTTCMRVATGFPSHKASNS